VEIEKEAAEEEAEEKVEIKEEAEKEAMMMTMDQMQRLKKQPKKRDSWTLLFTFRP
jgi:hypothetical protein